VVTDSAFSVARLLHRTTADEQARGQTKLFQHDLLQPF